MSLASWFGLAAAAVTGYVVVNLLRYRALLRRGIRTEGLVVDAIEESDSDGEQLVVAFADRQGARHHVVTRGGAFGWRRKIGQPVTVAYDPSRPRRARVHEDVRMQTGTGIVLALVFAAIGISLSLR